MTVTRRLRIECDRPVVVRKEPRNLVRDKVENYQAEWKLFEAWKKGEVDAAIKKKIEEKQKKLQAIPWFFLYAHILFVFEILIWMQIRG